VAIAVRTDDEWRRLAQHLGGDGLAGDPRFLTLASRTLHEDELGALTEAWTRECDAGDVEAEPPS